MTDAQLARFLADVERDQKDPELFCRESLTVSSKLGHVVDFIPGPAQSRLFDAQKLAWEAGRPVRIIYLKARQVWVSTAYEATLFQKLPFNTGQRAKVIAHDSDSTDAIYGYFKQFIKGYKAFRNVLKLPRIVKNEDGHIIFDNLSEIMVATAGSPNATRGFQLRHLHLSEVAFWAHAEVLMNAALNTLPRDPGTSALIESTANGAGGYFWELWKEATDPARRSAWTPLFFAWWEHPEYYAEIEGDIRRFRDSLDEEEEELVKRYGVTLKQLAWRRWKISEAKGSVASFHQEFPSSPDEAFLNSGRPRFSMKHVQRMPEREPAFVGDLYEEKTVTGIKPYRIETPNGTLSIWKNPQKGARYAAGVDICEGKDASAIGGKVIIGHENTDFSVMEVLDADSGEQVAEMRGRIQPGAFAEMCTVLGRYYDWPYLVVEANGPGLAFLEVLTRLDSKYPTSRLYHRQADPSEQYTTEAANLLDKLGWKTGQVTRPQLVSKVDNAIRGMEIFVHSKIALGELRSFVVKPSGKPEAQDGTHDDCVIALGLAIEGIITMPPDVRLKQVTRDELSTQPKKVRYNSDRRSGNQRGVRIRF